MEKKSCPGCDGMFVPLTGGGLRAHGPVHARCTQVSDPTPEEEAVNDDARAELEAADVDDTTHLGTGVYGVLETHRGPKADCSGPNCEETVDDIEKGPWFGAMENSRCSVNDCKIYEGDRIRADGQGEYECEDCGDFDDVMDRHVRVSLGMELDPFDVPTPAAEQKPDLNVSGQPKARYEWRGSVNMGYLVRDPGTGDFRRYAKGTAKGFTRVTTFVKAASDSKAINDWGKRNIVIGASRRPNVLLRANGLTHENDRAALTGIVAELEEAAGAKVGSDLGTFLHEFTEQVDAGLKTWQDAPPQFQRSILLYVEALERAGFEPVFGLIERTTMVREFGGVVGTFDRVFYHRPSGTYMVGDLKTGKTMAYSMDETNTQMWLYAHGVNQSGVYDWNTDTWDEPHTLANVNVRLDVREDVGVIIHMPVQGEQAGTVSLVHADLTAGARHAELCHAIRSRHKSKVTPFVWSGTVEQVGVEEDWEALFSNVSDSTAAALLWRQAKDEGVPLMELQWLVQLAQRTLRGKG